MGTKPPAVIHSTAVVDSTAKVGAGSVVWSHACILAEAVIGEDCRIGHGAFVDRGVKIGDRAVIHNHACIYRPVELHDDVFVGPHAVFVNDPEPRSDHTRDLGSLGWRAERGTTIGASATIMSDVTLAEYCFVAAGAVVTRDTLRCGVYVGVPARLRGFRCRCGQRFALDLGLPEECPRCHRPP
jgi:UDP-2-acetamido-3-amino-2,3-dideoxy-glucuronate N-acetyltransferase